MARKPGHSTVNSIEDVTDGLIESYVSGSEGLEHVNSYELPSMQAVDQILYQTRALMFPGFVGHSLVRATMTELREHIRDQLVQLATMLKRQTYRGLHHKVQQERGTAELDCPHCAAKAAEITHDFLSCLVDLRADLATDVEAHYQGDPAATGRDEIIFCYPGMYAISAYRIANRLLRLGAKLIPRMMSELAHEKVGIEIHPGAQIGRSFCIDHGTGVVIGETSIIGERVKIYQGVTLGALSVRDRGAAGTKRHPTIEDDVVIYSGATILGGDTIIGRGSVIGGNCWVTSSVGRDAIVTVEGKRPSTG